MMWCTYVFVFLKFIFPPLPEKNKKDASLEVCFLRFHV